MILIYHYFSVKGRDGQPMLSGRMFLGKSPRLRLLPKARFSYASPQAERFIACLFFPQL
jgi:hypothetical protein